MKQLVNGVRNAVRSAVGGLNAFSENAEPRAIQSEPKPNSGLIEGRVLDAVFMQDRAKRLFWKGKYEEAYSLFGTAQRVFEEELALEHSYQENIINDMVECYEYHEKYVEAESLLQRRLRQFEEKYGPDDYEIVSRLNKLGLHYYNQRDFSKTEPVLLRALDICKNTVGLNDLRSTTALVNLAMVYTELQRDKEAAQLYKQALTVFEENQVEPTDSSILFILRILSDTYRDLGKIDEAKSLLKRYLVKLEQMLGPYDFDVRNIKERISSLDGLVEQWKN